MAFEIWQIAENLLKSNPYILHYKLMLVHLIEVTANLISASEYYTKPKLDEDPFEYYQNYGKTAKGKLSV